MTHNPRVLLVLLITVVLGATASAHDESWQKIAPVGATFTISMPTRAVDSMRIIIWNDKRDMIHVNLYESLNAGKRYLAGEFFKTPAGRFSGLSSFESFVDGIEYSFKTRQGEVPGSLIPDHQLPVIDGVGKQYQAMLGSYPGVLRLVGKDNAFYVLMVVGADANDADTQRFFSAFMPGETNTAVESSGVIIDVPPNAAQIDQASKTLPPGPWLHPGRPINGGILNGKAVSLPVPQYPAAARLAGDAGEVAVQIIIDEQGNVVWAEASEGPATLREAAETSARKARFPPTKLMGQPIKISGRVIYNFVRDRQ